MAADDKVCYEIMKALHMFVLKEKYCDEHMSLRKHFHLHIFRGFFHLLVEDHSDFDLEVTCNAKCFLDDYDAFSILF